VAPSHTQLSSSVLLVLSCGSDEDRGRIRETLPELAEDHPTNTRRPKNGRYAAEHADTYTLER